jgi:hypothetical protein
MPAQNAWHRSKNLCGLILQIVDNTVSTDKRVKYFFKTVTVCD